MTYIPYRPNWPENTLGADRLARPQRLSEQR